MESSTLNQKKNRYKKKRFCSAMTEARLAAFEETVGSTFFLIVHSLIIKSIATACMWLRKNWRGTET